MKIDKLNLDGKKGSIEVLDKIFLAKVNKRLVNGVLYKTNANYKGRHAKTKQQNEVSGPTSKIYAQKGTGGARHASKKAPIFVGGGIAHGPKGELAYKKRKLNKSEKKLSIASLMSEKNKSKDLIIFSDFNNEINVVYSGVVPNLFEEGKGVVAEGFLKDRNFFLASKILAKHDENYMPPEVKVALEEK